MLSTRLSMKAAFVFAAALALSVGGCGKGSPGAAHKVARAIYTSASDCADGAKLPIEECERMIQRAIASHEKSAPTYSSLRSCETAEGADKCERAQNDSYRPRLLAYIVFKTEAPYAQPLYATPKGEPGFRSADKTMYLSTDDTLMFSSHAESLYETFAGKARNKRASR